MDKSVDSIGSCSLDVDADSTDFSDTSGSLNLLTPSSGKDFTREFTARIKERCQVHTNSFQQSSLILNPSSGKVSTVLNSTESPISLLPNKKPSYLNLACCVNGYSNLTTYDSKLRQNINKSREVSPIRPSSTLFQYSKVGNFLAPPGPVVNISSSKLKKMDSNKMKEIKKSSSDTADNAITGHILKVQNGNHHSNHLNETKNIITSPKSFIQQRVERLYGPAALAQGFYSPKKTKSCESSISCERTLNTQINGLKSPTLIKNSLDQNNEEVKKDNHDYISNENDLPVMRHLRPEFRAQLPVVSPKRNQTKFLEDIATSTSLNSSHSSIKSDRREEDTDIPLTTNNIVQLQNSETNNGLEEKNSITIDESTDVKNVLSHNSVNENICKIVETSTKYDGNYFLKIIKAEQNRLLLMAASAEKELELLSGSDISEEVFGYLRSAAGKARLFVAQKMKQFEGLCNNSLNQRADEKFPTTPEDLQGFWDMLLLQVDNIDSLFKELEQMKANNWKTPEPLVPKVPMGSKLTKRPIPSKKANGSSKENGNTKTGTNGVTTSKKSLLISAAAQKREAQRKQLMELKRKNKIAVANEEQETQNSNHVEIFVNEACS